MKRVRCLLSRLCAVALSALLVLPAVPAKAYMLTYGTTYKDSSVNLRQQPTQYSTRIGSYAEGSWMEINGESGNWYSVVAPDGKTGYMSKNYVSVPTESFATIGVVSNPKSTSFLNLRSTPSMSARVLGIYYNGVPCVLLDHPYGWYRVRVNGTEGYFREEFIREQNVVFSEAVATIVTPNNSGLNLRSGPGMGYPAIAQYRGGRYVMVLQQGIGWWKVSIDGNVGFMNASFLKSGVLDPDGTASEDQGSDSPAWDRTGYAIVTNPRANQVLNLRENASTTSRAVGQYISGTRVNVLRQGTEWCRVQVVKTGAVGYMMTAYLTMYNLPQIPVMTVNHPQRTFVNLRSTPSMSGNRVLARMPHGAEVTVVTPGDSWVQVRYNGYTGYAVAYFLK